MKKLRMQFNSSTTQLNKDLVKNDLSKQEISFAIFGNTSSQQSMGSRLTANSANNMSDNSDDMDLGAVQLIQQCESSKNEILALISQADDLMAKSKAIDKCMFIINRKNEMMQSKM
ncbi:Hypothetical_protein [Hexamita inflata]|uniref:Hypothetical_protein n=1 Tax=Hexamita inflata TaxID=28002 RepID=A0AA86P7S4_9EUKA|nr:Hypothetical protein HINF_LOCUS19615 [Hexamita inflata]CAI9969349.1 Hypothetical protein HINF_LOCUS56994 [Hexamita inflata]